MVQKARILGFKLDLADLADFLDGFLKWSRFKRSNVEREVNEGNIVQDSVEFKH
jgi:hypothetical protein